MEILLEFILELIFEPIGWLIVGSYSELRRELFDKNPVTQRKTKLPKWLLVVCLILYTIFSIALFLNMIGGFIAMIFADTKLGKGLGAVSFFVGIAFIVVLVIIAVRKSSKEEREKKLAAIPQNKIIGFPVRVAIDRHIGTVDPDDPEVVYEVSYGHTEDNRQAYLLGVDAPVDYYYGKVAAIIRREQGEQILVVVPENYTVTNEEIIRKTEFKEKFFKSVLIAGSDNKQ